MLNRCYNVVTLCYSVSSLFSSSLAPAMERDSYADVRTYAAAVTGQPAVKRSRTASPAQPRLCRPPMGQSPFYRGAGSRTGRRGLFMLFRDVADYQPTIGAGSAG